MLETILKGELVEEREFIFDVDSHKAFEKLASRQFSDPFDSIRELIANAVDSYHGTETKERRIDMILSPRIFQIIDYGPGLSEERVSLLRTLGATDKRIGSDEFIGRFGVGFASLFNPDMRVRQVKIHTANNGTSQELVFESQGGDHPSYKRYTLDRELRFGTQVRVYSTARDFQKKAEEKIREVCAFLPFNIHLNGEKLRTKPIKKRETAKTVLINEGGIQGHLSIDTRRNYYDHRSIDILSHHLPVSKEDPRDLFQKEYLGTSYFTRAVSGTVNANDLRLVVSRNEVVRDYAYEKVLIKILEKNRELLQRVIDRYKNKGDPRTRIDLIANILRNLDDMERVKNGSLFLCDEPQLAQELYALPLFRTFESDEKASLKTLTAEADKHGMLLGARWESELEPYRECGYRAPSIVMEWDFSHYDDKTEKRKNRMTGLVKQLLHGYNVSEDDSPEDFRRIAKEAGLDPSRLEKQTQRIEDSQLENNERLFIAQLRQLFGQPELQESMQKNDLPVDVPIHFAHYKKGSNTTASYAPLLRRITLNKQSDYVQTFVQTGDPEKGVLYFLPLMAHELTHDEVHEHTKDFYIRKGQIDRDLKIAISRYLSRRDSG